MTLSNQTPQDQGSVYCDVCRGCGEVGCDGIDSFLNEHVKGKTDCAYEESYLLDIAETYKSIDEYINSEVRQVLDRLESERDTHDVDTGCSDEVCYVPLSAITSERKRYE